MENAGDRQQIDRSTWGWCKECPVLHDLADTAEKLRESDAVDAVVSQLGLPPEFNEEQAEDYENQIGFIRKLCMKAVVGRLDKVSRDGTERYTVHSVSCGSDALVLYPDLGITDRSEITRTYERISPEESELNED